MYASICKAALAIIAAISISACSHTPPLALEGDKCDLKRIWIEQPLPGEEPLESVLADPKGDMLFLSGGSQNGAFGTGFLDGWHERRKADGLGGLPQFSVVTGISTGALQATGAFIGRPDITVRGYTIDRESQLLDTYVRGSSDDGGPGARSALTAIRRGALADLVPLQGRLQEMLTDEVLTAVAMRYRTEPAKPRLLVGATDFDLGQAIAFDMTELAARYLDAAGNPDRQAKLKDCYVKALVASSIVPGAAKPVFIDNRKYIDGGVRFAVFDDQVGEILRDARDRRAEAVGVSDLPVVPQTSVYIIFNSDGEPNVDCAKVQSANCRPIESTVGQREDWDFITLVLGTVDMLVDQVQRLSIERARQRGDSLLAEVHFVRMNAEVLGEKGREFAIPDFDGSLTCLGWRKEDDRIDAPLEFHKRYMRCLIEYGRERGMSLDWDYDNSTEVVRLRESHAEALRAVEKEAALDDQD